MFSFSWSVIFFPFVLFFSVLQWSAFLSCPCAVFRSHFCPFLVKLLLPLVFLSSLSFVITDIFSPLPTSPFTPLHFPRPCSHLSCHHHTLVMRHHVHCHCCGSVPERPQGSNSCNTPDYTLSATTATRNITPPSVGRMQGGLRDEAITGVETSLITPTADCQ